MELRASGLLGRRAGQPLAILRWSTLGHLRGADGCGILKDHQKAAADVLGATRSTSP